MTLEPEAPRPEFRHERGRHGLIGPFSGRQLLYALGSIVAVAVMLVVISRPLGQVGSTGPQDPAATVYILGAAPTEGLRPGDRAPELTITRSDGSVYQLTDLSGKPVQLADLRGRAVWINFWASWCPPCQAETPVIRDTAAAYADRGLTVIGISVQETSINDVRTYATTYDLRYTVAADLEGDIFRRYKVYALPTQFFIDPNGIIRSVVQGPLSEAAAAQRVEAILPAASDSGQSGVPGAPASPGASASASPGASASP